MKTSRRHFEAALLDRIEWAHCAYYETEQHTLTWKYACIGSVFVPKPGKKERTDISHKRFSFSVSSEPGPATGRKIKSALRHKRDAAIRLIRFPQTISTTSKGRLHYTLKNKVGFFSRQTPFLSNAVQERSLAVAGLAKTA